MEALGAALFAVYGVWQTDGKERIPGRVNL